MTSASLALESEWEEGEPLHNLLCNVKASDITYLLSYLFIKTTNLFMNFLLNDLTIRHATYVAKNTCE